MNWTQIEGQWHLLAGEVRSHWAKLTDDDVKLVAGKKEQLVGLLQQRYGVLKDGAETQVDEWISKLKRARDDRPS